jgi:hypothetical protein
MVAIRAATREGAISGVVDVRFGSKEDICSAKRYFRFAPESRHKIRYFVSSTIVTDGAVI